jgi:hypothetical protein
MCVTVLFEFHRKVLFPHLTMNKQAKHNNDIIFLFKMIFFGTVREVWYFLKLFVKCGIFWNCSWSVVFFETVREVWYFLELFVKCGMFCLSLCYPLKFTTLIRYHEWMRVLVFFYSFWYFSWSNELCKPHGPLCSSPGLHKEIK